MKDTMCWFGLDTIQWTDNCVGSDNFPYFSIIKFNGKAIDTRWNRFLKGISSNVWQNSCQNLWSAGMQMCQNLVNINYEKSEMFSL